MTQTDRKQASVLHHSQDNLTDFNPNQILKEKLHKPLY